MKSPWLWLGALACGPTDAPLPPADLAHTFRELHGQIYEVYEVPLAREGMHDLLAQAFIGEALTDQYVEHWRTRVGMAEEGTGIVVSAVEYDHVTVLDAVDDGWRLDVAWWVRGIVQHKQHRHPRINRYRAIYTLVPTPDGWRIARTRMRDLARVATEVAADAVFDEAPGSGADEGFMDPLEMFEGGLFEEATP